jgi:hypothetical protein
MFIISSSNSRHCANDFRLSDDNFADHIVDEKIAISEYSLSASVSVKFCIALFAQFKLSLVLFQVACGKVTNCV